MFWPLFLHMQTGWKLSRHIQTAEVSATNQWCSHSSAVKHSDYPNGSCKGLSTIWRWMKYSTAIRILFFLVRSCSSCSILCLQNVFILCISILSISYSHILSIVFPFLFLSCVLHSLLFSSLPLESSAVAANDCCIFPNSLRFSAPVARMRQAFAAWNWMISAPMAPNICLQESCVTSKSSRPSCWRASLLCPIREYLSDLIWRMFRMWNYAVSQWLLKSDRTW